LSTTNAQKYINQFQHNIGFHQHLCTSNPESYYDWKITCLFYCSYHLIQGLAAYRKINIGQRHSDILWNLNPKNQKRPIQFKKDAFYAYDQLFEYSRTARYDGFTSFEDFQELKKADYEDALIRYEYLKQYIISQGLKVPTLAE
jgi:hypothetical protein